MKEEETAPTICSPRKAEEGPNRNRKAKGCCTVWFENKRTHVFRHIFCHQKLSSVVTYS